MRIVTFYFSGTGNTKWAAEQFCQIAEHEGQDAKCCSIEKAECPSDEGLLQLITDAEVIGFATPIYGATIAPIMKGFIEHILDLTKEKLAGDKRVYFINTVGYINAFGPIQARKLFANSRFLLAAYVNIKLSNNISTPRIKSNPISTDALKKRKEIALKTLRVLVRCLVNNKRYITGIGPYLLPGIIIRKKSAEGIKNNYRSLGVDSKACTQCLRCLHNCPTQSISHSGEGLTFLPSCTACMRCYNLCPKAAITFDNQYADPQIYHRYRGPGK